MTNDDKAQPEDNIFKMARICAVIGAVGGALVAIIQANPDTIGQMVPNGLAGFCCGFGFGFLLELAWGPFFPGKTTSEDTPSTSNTTSTGKLTVRVDRDKGC